MSNFTKIMITAVSVSIGSQIYINVFFDDFIIAFAVIIFGVFLHLFRGINPINMAIVTGLCSPFFRFFMLGTNSGDWQKAAGAALPDIVFYFVFGIIYFFIYYKSEKNNYTRFWFSLAVCDAAANIAELIFMNGITYISAVNVGALFIIGVMRASFTLAVVLCIDTYKSLLAKEEHEERYKKLMVMTSTFDSEVYSMKKGIAEIEDVMKKAFDLYKRAENENLSKDIQNITLDIAKDVHEIKKGYIRVIKGLEDNFLTELKVSSIDIKDLVNILEADIKDIIHYQEKNIELNVKVHENFVVKEHYLLMSVLRNLVINAVDAIEKWKAGRIKLEISKEKKDDEEIYVFEVTDNGQGIKKEDMGVIFETGYSTKFDSKTGNISRGIGLTVVKDLINNVFRGNIEVFSEVNKYTTFRVSIPEEIFEGEVY